MRDSAGVRVIQCEVGVYYGALYQVQGDERTRMNDPGGHVVDIPEQNTDFILEEIECKGEALDLPCIRCGVCCSIYQVRMSKAEGLRIARRMGIDFYDWVGRYCEPRWPDPRSYLIRHENGACAFLERQEDVRFALCRIYEVRPHACRDWAAGPFKPACADGLKRLWNVAVDEEGSLQGTTEAVQQVRLLLKSTPL